MAASGALGETLAGWIGPRTQRNRKIMTNLRVAFPDKSRAEIKALSVSIWRNFGRIVSEYPAFRGIFRRGRENSPFDFELAPGVENLLAEGRPMIFVGAHISNWEFTALGIRLLGAPLSVVYSKLRNGVIDEAIRQARTDMDCGLIARTDGLRPLVACLTSGTSIGILADRRIKTGAPTSFFGRETYFSQAPGRLAVKYGAPVVPAFVSRPKRGRVLLRLGEPIDPASLPGSDRDKAAEITERVTQEIETEIRRRPGDWLCSQRIWPGVSYDDAPAPRGALSLDA